MDRDRDEDERRLIPRGRKRGLPGPDRDDPPADKFDPAEFDTPPEQPPSPVDRTRSAADFAQFFKLVSALETGMQRILVNFGMFRDLAADSRASVTEAAAQAAKHAKEQADRDKAIIDRLIDPERLGAYAATGAKAGVNEAIGDTVARLERRIDADVEAHERLSRQMAADQADRRDHELRRRRHDTVRNGITLGIALLIPTAFGLGTYIGHGTGEDAAYARARDEVAAASWANTANGKLARKIDQASTATLPMIADCSGTGWIKDKHNGQRVCFGGTGGTGWYRP